MLLDLNTPCGAICLHPVFGPGRLMVNYKANAFGTPVRVIQLSFPTMSEWQYASEHEEYLDILPPSNSAIASA